MSLPDLFVGAGCAVLGVTAVVAAATNWEPAFQLPKARLLEDALGRRGVRIFYAVFGLLLVALGVAIAQGFQLRIPGLE